MLKLRKQKKDGGQHTAPLTLQAAQGALQRTFDAEIIDTFRHMSTDLACNGGLPRRIALASALQGEGVTFATLALATILASDTSDRICVVDLNWWTPGMLAQLDPALSVSVARGGRKAKAGAPMASAAPAGARPGVAQVVAGKVALDDALLSTELPNLHLLPAGDLAVEQRPVLARSTGLRTLVEALSERFDHLLLDVPAILSTSDAIALASLGDACCLVVRHGVTPTPTVQRALDDIRHLKVLGVILNQVTIKTPRWLRTLIPQE